MKYLTKSFQHIKVHLQCYKPKWNYLDKKLEYFNLANRKIASNKLLMLDEIS